ncbi:glutamate racemase [bacterium]|nr:glutamate racemase [bacterium]
MSTLLVFDSGVGGLSIVDAITESLPNVTIAYVSDNEAFPYGTKPEDELIERVSRVLSTSQSSINADAIVVACNTASTVTLPILRQQFTIPIIGVVPAIKPAAAITSTKAIGLLATPGTIKREYTANLVDTYASDCQVTRVGCSELVQIAEQKLQGELSNINQLASLTQALNKPEIDTVVLACTHFPLLKPELMQALPNIKHWVDSGQAIARRATTLLLNTDVGDIKNNISYFTKDTNDICGLHQALSQRALDNVQFLAVD